MTHGDLTVCRECELKALCTRCHGFALVEDGDMYGPSSENCRQALARRLVMIEKGALPPDYRFLDIYAGPRRPPIVRASCV